MLALKETAKGQMTRVPCPEEDCNRRQDRINNLHSYQWRVTLAGATGCFDLAGAVVVQLHACSNRALIIADSYLFHAGLAQPHNKVGLHAILTCIRGNL